MNQPIHIVTNQFLKRVKGIIHEGFKNVKIIDKSNEELKHLYNKRRILQNKTDENSKCELEKADQELSEKYSDVMSRMILNYVKGMEDNTDGPFS